MLGNARLLNDINKLVGGQVESMFASRSWGVDNLSVTA